MRLPICLIVLALSAPGAIHYADAQSNDDAGFDVDQIAAVLTGGTAYTVEGGDTLSGIAGRFYGEAGLWPAIQEANEDALGGGIEIHPGMELAIPSLDDALASDATGDAAPRRNATDDLGEKDEELMLDGVREAEGEAAASGPPPDWMYSEGIARAIRREYMTFENQGRIAYVDPALKEGDPVYRGQMLAYQDQARPTASVTDANAQIVNAQSQLSVAEATLMEAQASLTLYERTFQRFARLLEQNSASQQEYDEAQARLESARAGVLKAERQIEAARATVGVATAGATAAQVGKDESYLISPIDGVIARLNVKEGSYYSPSFIQAQSEQKVFDTVPIVIIDPSSFEIAINVPSTLYDALAVGTPALIDIVDPDASLEERLPDEADGPPKPAGEYPIEGYIYSISPVMDPDLRNFNVLIHTTRGAERLRDGETVLLWIRRQPI